MTDVFNIGKTIRILANLISLKTLNEPEGETFYEATKKQIKRMTDYDFTKMKEKDFDRYFNFVKKVDNWAEWAKKEGYLQGYQQTAMSDFYLLMFEAAKMNMPIDKNMTEHFFCYAIAKVLFNQLQEYMKKNPKESKYEAMYWCFATFEFFGDDTKYLTDYNPVSSTFALLTRWVKDINQLIKYWQDHIDNEGKRENPPDIKDYILKWQKGRSPAWAIIKLFFDNDLCPPDDYFIFEEDKLKKDAYRTFKGNLFFSFILTNLFDYLEKENILSKESRLMIRTGTRLYYRDFYIKRRMDGPDYSEKFEEEAKKNLMFRTLFCMLDGTLSQLSVDEYLNSVYLHPEYPILLD